MSSYGPRFNAACRPADFDACATLAQRVDLYLLLWGDRPDRERAWRGDQSLTFDPARRALYPGLWD